MAGGRGCVVKGGEGVFSKMGITVVGERMFVRRRCATMLLALIMR